MRVGDVKHKPTWRVEADIWGEHRAWLYRCAHDPNAVEFLAPASGGYVRRRGGSQVPATNLPSNPVSMMDWSPATGPLADRIRRLYSDPAERRACRAFTSVACPHCQWDHDSAQWVAQ